MEEVCVCVWLWVIRNPMSKMRFFDLIRRRQISKVHCHVHANDENDDIILYGSEIFLLWQFFLARYAARR